MPFARLLAGAVFTASILLQPVFSAPVQTGASTRQAVEKVRKLFAHGSFDELEAVEHQSRDLSIVLTDGQPLRAALYRALSCLCSSRNQEEKLKELAVIKARVGEWQKAFPQSIAARLAEAFYYNEYAWAVRGQDYAYNVPESAWPIYRQNIAMAAKVLDTMGKDAREYPEWYVARLSIMRQQSGPREEYERLLEEAMQRHPRYLPIYFEGGTFHSRIWGGSNEEMNAFIDQAVARTESWLGDSLYARIQWSSWTSDMFDDGQADWRRMKKSFERILKDYPDAWNLNNFGKFACMGHDPQTTLDVMNRIQGSVLVAGWDGMSFYAECKAWAIRETAGH